MQDTLTRKLPVVPRLGSPWLHFTPKALYRFLGEPQWTDPDRIGQCPLIMIVCEVRDGQTCEFSAFMIDHADLLAKALDYSRPFVVIDGVPRSR